MAHCYHVSERRFRWHRAQHVLRSRYSRFHWNNGKVKMQRLIQKFLRDLHAPFVFLGHETSKKKKITFIIHFCPQNLSLFYFWTMNLKEKFSLDHWEYKSYNRYIFDPNNFFNDFLCKLVFLANFINCIYTKNSIIRI